MSTFTESREVKFTTTKCIACSGSYALDQDVIAFARKRGGYHCCPYCKTSQGWEGESHEAEVKRKEAELQAEINRANERARRAKQDAEHFEASRNAYKGQVTRLKNRAAAGMCPCCNRHFTNLERHMGTKHPDFTKPE